jgi:hypothetical protein
VLRKDILKAKTATGNVAANFHVQEIIIIYSAIVMISLPFCSQ